MRKLLEAWATCHESRCAQRMNAAEARIRPLGLTADEFDRRLAPYARRWRRAYKMKIRIFAAKSRKEA